MINANNEIASVEGSRMELMAEYMAITKGLVNAGIFTKKEIKLLFKMGLPGCKDRDGLMARFIMETVKNHQDELEGLLGKGSDEYDTLFN